jgi:hypothetical protein
MPRDETVAPDDIVDHTYVLDWLFYAAKVCAVPPLDAPSLGERFAKQQVADCKLAQVGLDVAPSTVQTLIDLSSSNLYTTRPPHLEPYYDDTTPQFYTAWHKGLQAAQPFEAGVEPEFVPVATVEWDNKMLRWPLPGDKSRTMCAEGFSCAAAGLIGAPGPLPAYYNPGEAANPPAPAYCLLCIREDVEGLVKHAEAVAQKCGRGARIQPPFKNLVGCPGGYDVSACSVRPGTSQVFSGGVHIVGTSGLLEVRVSTSEGVMFVDQSRLIFDPLRDLSRGGQLQAGVPTNDQHFLG